MGLWRHGTLFKSPFLAVESRGGAAACCGGSAAAAAGDDGFGDNAGDHGALVIVVDDGVGDGGDYHCQGRLQKNTFAWAYRSRGLRVHRGKEVWQQIAGMVTGAGSQGLTSRTTSTKQREQTRGSG